MHIILALRRIWAKAYIAALLLDAIGTRIKYIWWDWKVMRDSKACPCLMAYYAYAIISLYECICDVRDSRSRFLLCEEKYI